MNRRWLVLSVALLTGCSQGADVAVPYEPPPPTDTNFDRLAEVLAGIPDGGEVLIYEGLPSEFWEPELRLRELKEQETIEVHGYPVYDDLQTMPEADAGELTRLFTAKESFARYRSQKPCGGFQPEFCLQWNEGEAATVALISMECGEVKLYGPRGELHCDLAPAAVQTLKALLLRYQKNSPAPGSGE